MGPPTWGDVLTVVSFVIILHMYHTRNVIRFTRLESRVNIMWSQLRRKLHMDDNSEEDDYNG